MKHAKGFTLIELLLVVGIVTLLSSVLFYNTSEAKKKAEDSHMQAESEQVKTAVTLYKNDTGRYPLTSTGPVPSSRRGMLHSEADPNSDYIATMQELVNGGYISEIPRSPDGQSYAYGVSEDGENAMFVATLKRSGSRSSSKNSCEFVYVQSQEPTPTPTPQLRTCYTTPGTAGGCWIQQPAVTEIQCSDPENPDSCIEVVISPEVTVCDPGTPPQTICTDGPEYILGTPPRMPEEVTCGGGYESDYCQCI